MQKGKKGLSIRFKIMLLIFGAAFVVSFSISAISIFQNFNDNMNKAQDQLESASTLKKMMIEDYFKSMLGKLHVIKDNPFIQNALLELDSAFMAGGDSVDNKNWRKLAQRYDPIFKDICHDLNIDDIILMCTEGSIVYTMQKDDDLGLFITEDKLKNTSFGHAFKLLQQNPDKEAAFGDFVPYVSVGNKAFLLARILDWQSGKLAGHLGFRLSSNYLDKISNERTGMGESGSSYLVGKDKDGRTSLRSTGKLQGKEASIGDEKSGPFIKACLNEGKSGVDIKQGSNGDAELIVFQKLDIPDLNWGIFGTRAVSEINSSLVGTILFSILLSLLSLGLATIISLVILNSIIKPLKLTQAVLQDIAEGEGDLRKKIIIKSKDEIGELAESFNQFVEKLKIMVIEIKQGTEISRKQSDELLKRMAQTSESSQEIAQISETLKESVVNQAASVEEVASTIEEITKTIEQQDSKILSQSTNITESSSAIEQMIANIKSITQNLNNNTEDFSILKSSVNEGSENIDKLRDLSQELSSKSESVLSANSVIANIAAQTNLLAMNAAIEAAHAGEAGRGFAVVADEIRKLAETSNVQSKTINENIKTLGSLMENLNQFTDFMTASFQKIENSMNKVTNIEREILSALDEQSAGGTQILEALTQINQITHEVHSGSAEMLSGSKSILEETNRLVESTEEMKGQSMDIINKIKNIGDDVVASNQKVGKTAESISLVNKLVADFRTE